MRPLNRVIKQYGIDKLSPFQLRQRLKLASVMSQGGTPGSRAHWRAVIAACEHYLNIALKGE